MNIRNLLGGVVVAVSLAACQTVPQGPIALAKDKLVAQTGRVGVAMRTPTVDMSLPGAGCLLCLAAASIANSSLNSYSHTLKADDLLQVKTEIVELLRKKGIDASAVDGQLNLAGLPDATHVTNMATKDFSSFAKTYDHLIVINVQEVGFTRTYSAYIPTSDPKASLQGFAFMVDLKTNSYEWFDHFQITKGADGKWDEAPTFPGLTNAYYQAIEQGKDRLKAPFAE